MKFSAGEKGRGRFFEGGYETIVPDESTQDREKVPPRGDGNEGTESDARWAIQGWDQTAARRTKRPVANPLRVPDRPGRTSIGDEGRDLGGGRSFNF